MKTLKDSFGFIERADVVKDVRKNSAILIITLHVYKINVGVYCFVADLLSLQ